MNKPNPPTEPQKNALRKFGVANWEIEKMTFAEASEKLNILITNARNKKVNTNSTRTIKPIAQDNKPLAASTGAKAGIDIKSIEHEIDSNVTYAIDLVMQRFNIQINNLEFPEYIDLVVEIMHERHALILSERIQRNKLHNLGEFK